MTVFPYCMAQTICLNLILNATEMNYEIFANNILFDDTAMNAPILLLNNHCLPLLPLRIVRGLKFVM